MLGFTMLVRAHTFINFHSVSSQALHLFLFTAVLFIIMHYVRFVHSLVSSIPHLLGCPCAAAPLILLFSIEVAFYSLKIEGKCEDG